MAIRPYTIISGVMVVIWTGLFAGSVGLDISLETESRCAENIFGLFGACVLAYMSFRQILATILVHLSYRPSPLDAIIEEDYATQQRKAILDSAVESGFFAKSGRPPREADIEKLVSLSKPRRRKKALSCAWCLNISVAVPLLSLIFYVYLGVNFRDLYLAGDTRCYRCFVFHWIVAGLLTFFTVFYSVPALWAVFASKKRPPPSHGSFEIDAESEPPQNAQPLNQILTDRSEPPAAGTFFRERGDQQV